MTSAAKPDFLTQDAFRSLLPPDPSPFMSSLVASCFESERIPVNEHFWHFPLRSRSETLDANALTRQLRVRPVSVVLRAIEPIILDACQPYETFEAAIQAARDLFIRFATITLSLSRYMERLSAWLRPFGTFGQKTPREGNLPLMIEPTLVTLRHIMAEDPPIRGMLESGQLPREGVFFDAWRITLERFGHRGENETDLAVPRYAEQPELWIQAILSPETLDRFDTFPRRSLRRAITFPIWRMALRYPFAREYFRHSAMYAFAHLRNELLRLGDLAAARGQIEGKHDIWLMTVSEVIALDTGASLREEN